MSNIDWGQMITAEQRAAETRAAAIVAIKAECERRIVAIVPLYKQINSLADAAEAMMLYGPDPASWPPELQAKQSAAVAILTETRRLRARSNEIELMEPLPADVTDDGLWAAE